jgi:hypothetical protein
MAAAAAPAWAAPRSGRLDPMLEQPNSAHPGRGTQLCGCCVQPVHQCPCGEASVGRQGSYDGGSGTLGVRHHGSTFVLGESWAKDLMTVMPVGATFPVESVVFRSIMSSMGENLVHILDKQWRRY